LKVFGNLIRRTRKAKNPEASNRHELKIVNSGPGAVILAVGGGKGGVGKSMITSNFGIMCAQRSYRTLLVDVDLGAANLHSFLGIKGSKLSLSSYLKSEIDDFSRLIKPTGVEGLDIVTGAMDSLDVPDMGRDNLLRLQDALYGIDYDYILLDLGPGTSCNVLDLLFFADEAVMITTPDPMSVENTYRYLKAIILRRIKTSLAGGPLQDILRNILKGEGSEKIRTIADIINRIRRQEKTGGELLKQLMGTTNLALIINQTRYDEDREVGMKMAALCSDNMGLNITHVGNIPYDEVVVRSVQHRKPLSLYFKETDVCSSLEGCVDYLINKNRSECMHQ